MSTSNIEFALGGKIYWRDLALQMSDVWAELQPIGGDLQHGDLDNGLSTFSIVLPHHHGGRCFHADFPRDAWKKAKEWLMSPDRPDVETLQPR